jgi:hypothetical protein
VRDETIAATCFSFSQLTENNEQIRERVRNARVKKRRDNKRGAKVREHSELKVNTSSGTQVSYPGNLLNLLP